MNDTISYDRTVDLAYTSQFIHIPFIVLANALVIVTFYYGRHLRTPDNFTIVFLSVADLLIGVVIVPIQVLTHLNHDYFNTNANRCIISLVPRTFLHSVAMSMLMLMTIDRCLAISCPFWYIIYMTNKKCSMVALVFVVIDANVYIGLFIYVLLYIMNMNEPFICEQKYLPNWCTYTFYAILTCKILISIICAIIVSFELWKSVKHIYIPGSSVIRLQDIKSLQKKSKMTILLMFMFVVLWVPSVVVGFIYDDTKSELPSMITGHILYLNSYANTCVYALTRQSYRRAFKFLLTTRPCLWKNVSLVTLTSSQRRSNAISRSYHQGYKEEVEWCSCNVDEVKPQRLSLERHISFVKTASSNSSTFSSKSSNLPNTEKPSQVDEKNSTTSLPTPAALSPVVSLSDLSNVASYTPEVQ